MYGAYGMAFSKSNIVFQITAQKEQSCIEEKAQKIIYVKRDVREVS